MKIIINTIIIILLMVMIIITRQDNIITIFKTIIIVTMSLLCLIIYLLQDTIIHTIKHNKQNKNPQLNLLLSINKLEREIYKYKIFKNITGLTIKEFKDNEANHIKIDNDIQIYTLNDLELRISNEKIELYQLNNEEPC